MAKDEYTMVEAAGREVRLSNPAKVYFPKPSWTKLDIAEYYLTVADAALVERALAGLDGCFHLAAVASVERGHREWLACHRTNLTGTIAVLVRASGTASGRPVAVTWAVPDGPPWKRR